MTVGGPDHGLCQRCEGRERVQRDKQFQAQFLRVRQAQDWY